ncbi:hypothetical protein TEQG_05318 [Trichophyton equinum CBS 127.97]|uniref:Uncharacterized protein n=1 Tax=Trichophyton equinum (strain ATCC MYA-4606 / CBS 127.97) TaxID=559882 RepID=F2PWP7_TRIEC|nr:hypothetical protein TEQG_05318 [Trichophyton equinum CBS 127.97]
MPISRTRLMDVYLVDTSSSSRLLRYPKSEKLRLRPSSDFHSIFARLQPLVLPLARRPDKPPEQHRLPLCRQPVAPSSALETLFFQPYSLVIAQVVPQLGLVPPDQTPQLRQPADHPSTPFCQLDVRGSPAEDSNITKGRANPPRACHFTL